MKQSNIYNGFHVSHLRYSEYENRVGIGYVLQCRRGDSFGIVYGYRDHGRAKYREKTWIYYFKKSKNLQLEKFTEITYLKSPSGYDKDETFEVTDITPLSQYSIINSCDKEMHGKEKLRIDGIYHLDSEWSLMCQGVPYIKLSDCAIYVYYPIIDKKNKSITFHDYNVYTRGKRVNIISCFIGMYDLRLYSTEPKFDYVSSKLDSIKKYIDNFKLTSSIRTFYAGQSGYFHCYPGRDDSFFITDYRRTKSKDSYLKQLVELREEERYYNCCGQGKDEEDYDRINKEETIALRKEVKQKYDKDAHYMFLINEFLTELKEKRKEYLLYAEDIKCFIEEDDEKLFQQEYEDNDYKELASQYNKRG